MVLKTVGGGGSGSGTVTQISAGLGLTATPNPITSVGTLAMIANTITFGSNIVSLGDTVNALQGVAMGNIVRASGDFTFISANSATNITPVLTFNAANTVFAAGSSQAGGFNQSVMQNRSNSATTSTNWIVENDLGTDTTYYGEFGMNSSGYSPGTPVDFFSLNNGVYFSSHDGDVSVGSDTTHKTYFTYNGGANAHVLNNLGAVGFNTNIGANTALTGITNFGTANQVLISQGNAAAPKWATANNAILANSSVTLGNTVAALGSTVTLIGNLTLTGANVTATSGNVVLGIPTGSIRNTYLNNTTVTFGNTAMTLGSASPASFGNAVLANPTISSASSISDTKGPVRDIPQNSQITNYTLVIADDGKHVYSNSNVTVPASVFSTGNVVSVVNNSNLSTISILRAASVNMYLAGNGVSSNRTLSANYGVATILCVAANTFVITGSGLT